MYFLAFVSNLVSIIVKLFDLPGFAPFISLFLKQETYKLILYVFIDK